jgi:phosphoesterase RecJ-like protein
LIVEKFYPNFAADFGRLIEALTGKRVAIVGHARPDGDCIGAQVALARVLKGLGLDVVCVNADAVPRRLQFLSSGEVFIRTDEALASKVDWIPVFLDCADHKRAGERLALRFPAPAANIDHHLSNPGYAAINLVDGASAATCEILAGVLLDAGLHLDARAAQALFTGILTDTGQFRFNSTSRRCFVLAGELVGRGAVPADAGFELYERESMGKLQLLQRFLASLSLECRGRVCVGTLPDGIFEATSTTGEDTEGLVDYARSIDRVEVGVLIEERPGGAVKASLRAKDPAMRLDLVAAKFNGGGHACAAGLSLSGPHAANFRPRLISALSERIAEVDAQAARR